MKKIVYAALAFAPVAALAQGTNLTGIQQLVDSVGRIINRIIPIIFALAIIYFFWGVVQFLKAGGDPKEKDKGRNHMVYGVIAIAVMISLYGLVNWLTSSLGITPSSVPQTIPTVPGLQ